VVLLIRLTLAVGRRSCARPDRAWIQRDEARYPRVTKVISAEKHHPGRGASAEGATTGIHPAVKGAAQTGIARTKGPVLAVAGGSPDKIGIGPCSQRRQLVVRLSGRAAGLLRRHPTGHTLSAGCGRPDSTEAT